MLKTSICGVKLKNPTVLASGILGVTKKTLDRMGREGAGAVTMKSLCHEERSGNSNPTMFNEGEVFLLSRLNFRLRMLLVPSRVF